MEEPAGAYRDAEMRDFEEGYAVRKAEQPDSQAFERQADQNRQRIVQKYRCQVTVRESEFSMVQAGSTEDILEQLSTLDVEALRLGVGETMRPFYPDLDMEFVRYPQPYPLSESLYAAALTLDRRRGVSVEVYGSDPFVVRGSFANLKAEVERGIPWYAVLRAPWMWFIYTLVALAAAVIGAWPSFVDATTSNLPVYLVVAAIGVGGGTLLQALARTFLPGLEVLAVGQASKGGRGLAMIGTLILNFVLGIIVNVMTG